MKKFLFSITLISTAFAVNAQQILFQDFSNSTPGWITANGSSIGTYNNFYNNCASEYGIITPGVGGNNPAKVLSEIIIPNQQLLEVKFNIDRFDANLSCASHSNFGCPTSVDILSVASSYTGTDPISDGATIYSNNSGYLLPITGGTVSLIISLPPSLPALKIFFNFSTNNCNQQGTKYVMDKFYFTGYNQQCQITNSCPPGANNDYFNSGIQGFANSTLYGNVYGTNLAYTPPAAHVTYTTRSLTLASVSPDGGKDFDIDNTPLNNMTFSLISQTFTNADATFTFNADGTFSFLRLNTNKNQFFFTYRLTDPTTLYADAIVRIDFSSGGVLPVSLTNFKVAKSASGALLSWETAQELNNKGFDILRKTTGNFEKIGFVASRALNGYSSSKLAYSFEDRNMPKDKTVYYRLSQIDIDGKQFYSDIRIINNGDSKQPILIYPNPSFGNVQISLPSDMISLSDILVLSATGAVVQTINNTTDKQIEIKGLKSGLYYIKVILQYDNSVYTQKLIVQ